MHVFHSRIERPASRDVYVSDVGLASHLWEGSTLFYIDKGVCMYGIVSHGGEALL